jgi:hypothetical protein
MLLTMAKTYAVLFQQGRYFLSIIATFVTLRLLQDATNISAEV